MSALQSEVFEAFREMGVPEEQAMKAATALAKRDDDVIAVKVELNSIKSELVLHRWMLVSVLGMVSALFVKTFLHL